MQKTIRWGIIGCGDVTEKKSGPGFQKAENSSLVAVMRRDAAKVEDYARRHKVSKWYDNADDLINDPEVDAVYIATPPDSHKYYTLKASAARKAVYVEKPMARNFSECQTMIKACKQQRVPLFTAYYRRSLPRFLKVKQLLDSQVIGKIRLVRIFLSQPPKDEEFDLQTLPWRVKPNISGGGYFFDLASHTLDILDFYFGPIASAHGYAGNQMGLYDAEDIVSANFVFKNGIMGSGMWCFSIHVNHDQIEIVGEKGKLIFSTFSNSDIKLFTEDTLQPWTVEHPQHIQQPHIQSIVDELNGTGFCPSNGESAARTSWVMDQIIKNWRQDKGISFK
jgi:predicted dehydrogenase